MNKGDIKVLERLIKRYYGIPCGNHICPTEIYYEEIEAIENLISRNKELEEVVKTYNAIPNDYIPNDMKIVIADREYFNNGILKENIIPKSKVREIIENSYPDIAVQKLLELLEEGAINNGQSQTFNRCRNKGRI